MTQPEIQALLEKQRNYYRDGHTLSVDFRINQLKKLYSSIKKTRIGSKKCPIGRSRKKFL